MIDKIPSLPSDNLYKFGTAFGLLLIIIGGVGEAYATSQYNDKVEKFNIDIINNNKDRSNSIIAMTHEGRLSVEGPPPIEMTDISEYLYKLHERAIAETNQRRTIFYIGCVIVMAPMSLWYGKHQRYQDALVALENQNKVKEIEIAGLEADSKRRQIAIAALEKEKLKLEIEKLKKVDQATQALTPSSV